MLAALIFIISYSMYMYFLVLEIKPSQLINLTFAFYKLTIMTENNVHFLILKITKKFANLWWLNLGTESDLSTVWIFYCELCEKKIPKVTWHNFYSFWFIQKQTLKIVDVEDHCILKSFESKPPLLWNIHIYSTLMLSF